MLVVMEGKKTVESAMIGNEGIVGIEVFLGKGIPRDRVLVQVPGEAVAVVASSFAALTAGNMPWLELLQRYLVALMNQIARAAGCNRLHSVSERFARWLLMTVDRVGRDEFPMTHELLASMLGIRRASVSEAAESLQARGLIQYRQGRIGILDRDGLEAAACEDYRLTKAAYDQVGLRPSLL
jgi:CRP-like cAMP-binding protein